MPTLGQSQKCKRRGQQGPFIEQLSYANDAMVNMVVPNAVPAQTCGSVHGTSESERDHGPTASGGNCG